MLCVDWSHREGIVPVVIRIVSLRIYTGKRGISLQKKDLPTSHQRQLSETSRCGISRWGCCPRPFGWRSEDAAAVPPRRLPPPPGWERQAEVGRGAARSPGAAGEAGGGAGRDGPSLLLLLLEPVKLHSHFPQELPFHLPAPGACKTASVCLRRLSSPCPPSLPGPLQLRAPPRLAGADVAGGWGEAEGRGARGAPGASLRSARAHCQAF